MNVINKYIKASINHKFSRYEYSLFNKFYENALSSSKVSVTVKTIDSLDKWKIYDNCIKHLTGRFFQIKAIKVEVNKDNWYQPIIEQLDIGILALLGAIRNERLEFLIQLKVEPGNINYIQLSPTIQATKCNLDNVHNGESVRFMELIINNRENEKILLDRELSEQNGRFLRKKNRNIIKIIDAENLKINDNFIWLTIGQIKQLSLQDNLINMDLRSVLSGLSLIDDTEEYIEVNEFTNDSKRFLYQNELKNYNTFKSNNLLFKLSNYIERNKRYIEFVKFKELVDWNINSNVIKHKDKNFFRVIGTKINVLGREVKAWEQPLIKSEKSGHNVLFYFKDPKSITLLVQFKIECGSIKLAEISPTIQTNNNKSKNEEEEYLYSIYLLNRTNLKFLVKQSEEGGRFYREENYNSLLEIDLKQKMIIDMNINSNRYHWIELGNIIYQIKQGGPINMQLRGIIAMLSSEVI